MLIISKMIFYGNTKLYATFCCRRRLLLAQFFHGFSLFFLLKAEAQAPSAIFIFGDSTSDPGNNNYVGTVFKSNFPPYGRDFYDQIPTGRFSNGRLASDFIGEYIGVKGAIPPYLDPNLQKEDLLTGVSFASAGSGFDPLTPKLSNVISLSTQLGYFKEYQSKAAAIIGEDKAQELIKNAVYIISAGTNDFVVNYFAVPIRSKNYTVPAYIDFTLGYVDQFMQDLLELGARRIGVVGLTPMGCLPLVISLYSGNRLNKKGGCVDSFSSIARAYNQKLQAQLDSTQQRFAVAGSRIVLIDVYQTVEQLIFHAQDYGFEEISRGCCGTGWLEAAILCNPKSYICPDASKYVFWDSIHPTEKTYYIVFLAIRPAIDSIIRGD